MSKIRKTYRFSQLTLDRIADIAEWLPANDDTQAVEESISIVHTQLKREREMKSQEFNQYLDNLELKAAQLPFVGGSTTFRMVVANRDWEAVSEMIDTQADSHGAWPFDNEAAEWMKSEAQKDGYAI